MQAFLREDLEHYSRPAPSGKDSKHNPCCVWVFSLHDPIEFTEHQRSVFCVFSGQGVVGLRKHFNRVLAAEESRRSMRAVIPVDPPIFAPSGQTFTQHVDASGEDADPDAIDEDDVPEDGSEMVIDTFGLGVHHAAAGTIPVPPPIPVAPQDYPPGASDPPFVVGNASPSPVPAPQHDLENHAFATSASPHQPFPQDIQPEATQSGVSVNMQEAAAVATPPTEVPPIQAFIDMSSEVGADADPIPPSTTDQP